MNLHYWSTFVVIIVVQSTRSHSETPSRPIIVPGKTGRVNEPNTIKYTLVWRVHSNNDFPVDDNVLRYRMIPRRWIEARPTNVSVVPDIADTYEVSYTLDRLTSSSDYEARLKSHNANGWSWESRVYRFHTTGKHIN